MDSRGGLGPRATFLLLAGSLILVVGLGFFVWQRASTSGSGWAACGGEAPPRAGGGQWTCTFDDEFNGTRLNPALWSVTTSAATGYRSGPECYVDSPRTVSVANGVLSLSALRLAAPFACRTPYGVGTTSYASGMVTTQGHFAQTEGRFEIRAAFEGGQTPGIHSALWLFPRSLTYGKGASGEIDIAEYYGASAPDLGFATLKYHTWYSGQSPTVGCRVANPAAFHVYTLVWTRQLITISYDGHTCLSTQWAPARPLTAPQPFDQPFDVLLTQALQPGTATRGTALPFPVTMKVDYVRVWR